MKRHSTADGRQSGFRIRHSSLVTRHFLFCIAALVAFAARAEIPTTLEKNTAYVVDGETGAGPAKIFVENASLTLVNGALLNFGNTRSDTGTNFFLHIASGSTVTNYNYNLNPRTGYRVVVEGGSQLHMNNNPTSISPAGVSNVVLAVTNSFLNIAGRVNLTVKGNNTLISLCSSKISGVFPFQIYGRDNRVVISGDCGSTSRGISFFSGTNNWAILEDGARIVSTPSLQNYSPYSTNGFHIGRNAFLYGNMSQGATVRNGHLIVEEGGEFAMQNGDGNGFQGIDCEWIVNNGTISCSNNMLRIGQKESTYQGLRLVFNGDRASVFSRNTQVGHASNPAGLTLVYRPGPEGFGGTAPLRSTGVGGIYGCVVDIDLRAPLRRTAPNAILQVPIMKTSSTLACSAATLESLNSLLVSNPAGAEIVKDGNTLYCQIKNRVGTMVFVR